MLVRYLLGEMSQDEQSRVEESYFADDQLFEELIAVESELIIGYAQGRFSSERRKQLESHFLCSPARRHRVEIISALTKHLRSIEPQPLIDSASKERWWRKFVSFVRAGNR
jgi:anti-sigma factor RsiW